MFQLHEFFSKNSYIAWFHPYLFRTAPQSYLRGCILGLHPQYVHWVKHNSQLLGCAFFFPQSTVPICWATPNFWVFPAEVPEITE